MISRRRFLQSSVSLALVPLLPRVALPATLRIRPSWDVFRAGPSFVSFCQAVKAMKAYVNTADPMSWEYWVSTHSLYCPHGKAYFLAWHRGFLYSMENQLRQVSGDPDLVIPYWNYYDNPAIPDEFLDKSLPLYRNNRTGSDVGAGLSLDAFASTITAFQRGKTNAFEPVIEPRPHNNVHNLIGGAMGSIKVSPRDPIFWVHHANVDRLWVAWLNAGGGRSQPAPSNGYWSGSFQYGSAVPSMLRKWTTSTSTYLGYQYDNQTLPTSLPPSGYLARTTASLAGAVPVRPASVLSAPLGVARPLVLDERSVSVDVPLTALDTDRVRSSMLKADSAVAASPEGGPVRVVLDDVRLTGLGEKGGFFYDVYVNLPAPGTAGAPAQAYLLGSVGAFEIGVAQMNASMKGAGMHGMQDMGVHATHGRGAHLVFPVTEALRRIWPTRLDRLTISFVRVDGNRKPDRGEVIRIGAFRVEADPGN
jgi:tyrosinase